MEYQERPVRASQGHNYRTYRLTRGEQDDNPNPEWMYCERLTHVPNCTRSRRFGDSISESRMTACNHKLTPNNLRIAAAEIPSPGSYCYDVALGNRARVSRRVLRVSKTSERRDEYDGGLLMEKMIPIFRSLCVTKVPT